MSNPKQVSDNSQTGPGFNSTGLVPVQSVAPSPSPSTAAGGTGGSSQGDKRGKQG